MSPPHRSENGYRQYSEIHIEQLEFVLRAKMVGFTLDECKSLVELAMNPNRQSFEVKQKATQKLDEIELKLAELNKMKAQLQSWVHDCPGDASTECPILNNLSGRT